ncbi:M42 family metallopeptidase [Adlercreutzia caecimuris]|uniref:M42 family metallopeptidase n=3 Tax=Adlercreutzia caecimuris TaxID=671266 RepID=UPI001C3E3C8F|nr:M42 family metallopeptidase [Adlercreutzia caecimuris]
MKKKHVKFLKQLLETPSPTGFEEPAAALVRERLSDVADEITTDTMGSVRALLAGAEEGAPTLMLAAHMDEIGLMVTYISDEGFLSVASLGGVDAAILPGMRVDVHTASGVLRGVVGRKPIHLIELDERKNVTPLSSLVIDLGMKPKRVKKLVSVGDPITFGVGFERFGDGMAVSKCFDDKCGVWIACRVIEELAKAGGAPGDFIAAATTQEEIGTRGAMTSAHAVNPDVALAFDVTHATDYPGIDAAKYGKIVCGEGPVIARGPNINPVVFERLVAAAKAEGIPYQLEAEPSVTGTDARAIQVARDGIPTGLISVPLRYMHTPTEVVCLADLQATVRLIVRFARDLSADASFVPGMGGAASAGAAAAGEGTEAACPSEEA